MPTSPFGFDVRLIEPSGDPVYETSRAARQAYWKYLGEQGLDLFRRRVLRGRDRFGRRLTSIGPSTFEHRAKNVSWFSGKAPYSPMGKVAPTAPPLAPNFEKSRIIALMRFEVIDDDRAVRFYWLRDPHSGKDWGEILGFHRTGFTARTYRGPRPVPARDVIGFEPQEIRRLAALGDRWWKTHRHRWETQATRAVGPTAAGAPGRGPLLDFDPTRPGTIPGSVGASRRGLFGRVGSMIGRAASGAIDRAVGKLLEKTVGRFTGG